MAEPVMENGDVEAVETTDCDADSDMPSEAMHPVQENKVMDHSVSGLQSRDLGDSLKTRTSHQEVNSAGSAFSQSASSQPAISASHGSVNADQSGGLPPPRLVALTSPIPSLVQSLRISAIKTVKRTRQSLAEKLGHGSKTVDMELDARIESLRDIQLRYSVVLQLVNSFSTHFTAMISCHQALDAEFSDLAQKMPELHNEFAYNAETQRSLHRNGETLLGALSFFSNTLNTLCYKTIEDTLITVKQYEDARMEYDAFRIDAESKHCSPEAQQTFQRHKLKFEQLRQVLDVKLQLLDENRGVKVWGIKQGDAFWHFHYKPSDLKVKVMRQQLILFHNAIAAYFSGNQTALDGTVQQFNVPRRLSTDSQH